MKIPKLKPIWFIMGSSWWIIFGGQFDALSPGWIAVTSLQVVWLVWGISSFIADGSYIGSGMSREEKKRELQRQRTLELERELGIEPLNLDELDPIFEEIDKERGEK